MIEYECEEGMIEYEVGWEGGDMREEERIRRKKEGRAA